MRKHIFGFAIFSFIVGTAVIVSGFLFKNSPKEFKVFEVNNQEGKTYCRKNMKPGWRSDPANVKIEQAFLDLKTRELKTFVSVSQKNEVNKNCSFALHFFVKEEGQTRYLASERIWMNSSFDSTKESLLTSLKWLDETESYENLYVVPEMTYGWTSYKNNPPSFNYSTAAPVLLKSF